MLQKIMRPAIEMAREILRIEWAGVGVRRGHVERPDEEHSSLVRIVEVKGGEAEILTVLQKEGRIILTRIASPSLVQRRRCGNSFDVGQRDAGRGRRNGKPGE